MSLTAEQKALRAKEFLKDDVFLECIEKAKKRVLAEWALTGIDDAQTRETLFYKHRALGNTNAGTNCSKLKAF